MPGTPENIVLLDPAATAVLGGELGSDLSVVGLLLGLLLVLSGQLMLWVHQLRRRYGFDVGWTRSRGWTPVQYARLLRSAGALGLLLVLLRWLGSEMGTLWAIVGVASLLVALAASGTLQDAVAGLHVQFRLRLHEGDRIRVGEHAGELRSLHWDHVCLQVATGDAVYLPNRVLTREPVEVQPVRGAVPLALTLPADAVADIGALRDTVATLPYRIPGTPVQVLARGESVEVRCVLWSEAARGAAEGRLLQQADTSDDDA